MSRKDAEEFPRAVRSQRIRQLDVLRGIAILLVLFHHSDQLVGGLGPLDGIYRAIQRFGWTGVDLFFVLSGFLIGGILFREIDRDGRLRAGRFLIRRAFKIWPGYLALVLLAVFKESRHPEHPGGVVGVVRYYRANFLHLQNYFPNIRFHTWSLAVEEHFYLLLPLVLMAMLTRSAGTVRRWFPAAAVVAVVLIAVGRLVHGVLVPFTYQTHMYATHLRLDSLLWGVLLAHVATFSPDRFLRLASRPAVMAAVGIALICPMLFLDLDRSLFVQTAGFTLLYLGYGCIVIGLLGVKPGAGVAGRLLETAPVRLLAWVGVFSYAIYLWHLDLAVKPVLNALPLLRRHLSPELTSLAALTGCVAAAIVGGIVMTCLIEKPALAIRDRLFPTPATTPQPSKPDVERALRTALEAITSKNLVRDPAASRQRDAVR